MMAWMAVEDVRAARQGVRFHTVPYVMTRVANWWELGRLEKSPPPVKRRFFEERWT